ncbi:phosphoethanolamine transferase [Photobacterium swingsii]|uniref:phosphoethanolamine transferase n=1 Tax=Photobacterium swingsii TaxID=680026 RepID=UPI004067F6B0
MKQFFKSMTSGKYYLYLLSVVIIMICELFIRSQYGLRMSGMLHGFLLVALISYTIQFSKYKSISILAIIYLLFSYSSQVINMSIYGYWMPPISMILMLEKATEVFTSASDSMGSLLVSLPIVTIISFLALLLFKKRNPSKYFVIDVLFVVLIAFQPIKIMLRPDVMLGENLSSRYYAIKAAYYANSYLLGRTIIDEVTGKSYYDEYKADKPEVKKNKVKTLVFIQGESLTSHNMGVFGYQRNNTPWIESISKEGALVKKGYSAATFTDVTLPSIFNMIATPNGEKQISSRKTNLFRMAKDNGYQTSFFSAHAIDGMDLINKVGLEYIDHYTTASDLGNDNFTSALDKELIDYIETIDFSKDNFIVLHQIGSHAPYTKRVPSDFKPYGTGNYLDDYDNSVLYTDEFLQEVFDLIKSKTNNDFTFVFTSDHGQSVTDKTMGHGSLNQINDYTVPFVFYSSDSSVKSNYVESFSHCKMMFHQQLAVFLGQSLGYKVAAPGCKKGIVNGSRLNGSAGFKKIS